MDATFAERRDSPTARTRRGLRRLDGGRCSRDAIDARGLALLVVSGGSTPKRYFAGARRAQTLDWSRVAVTLADERRVPDDSPRSNARLVRETLLQSARRPRRNSLRSPIPGWRRSRNSPRRRARRAAAAARRSRRARHGRRRPHRLLVPAMPRALSEAIDPAARALVPPMPAPDGLEPRLTLTRTRVCCARGARAADRGAEQGRDASPARWRTARSRTMPIRAALRDAAERLTIFSAARS